MKACETPWSVGSMLICNKCGKSFDQPDQADRLKSDLRSFLKENDSHKKIRVMVSGCLNVCDKEAQAVCYQPNQGATEVFTADKNFEKSVKDLKIFLQKKI